MVKFKDIMKKAKEMAEKGMELVKSAMEFERLLSDFDDVVARIILDIAQENGYRGMGSGELGGRSYVDLAIEDESKVKHIIDRSILRRYSPKDREKILNVIPDKVRIVVDYRRKGETGPSILRASDYEDVSVSATLYYFVERKGGFFSKVKRDTVEEKLGGFSFKSSDFVDYNEKRILEDKLREYLEKRLRGLGLI